MMSILIQSRVVDREGCLNLHDGFGWRDRGGRCGESGKCALRLCRCRYACRSCCDRGEADRGRSGTFCVVGCNCLCANNIGS